MKLSQKFKTNGGQVAITVAMFFLLVSSIITVAISSPVISQLKTNKDLTKSKSGFYVSESGNEDVVYRVKNGMNVLSQESLTVNGGTATTIVSDVEDGLKEVSTIGTVSDRNRKLKSRIRTSTGVSFNYGLFVGQGGIEMGNNAHINGSVYSNGSIRGSSGADITGDVFVAPRPATTTDCQWIINNDGFNFGKTINDKNVMQSFKPTSSGNNLIKASLFLKKVGSPSNLTIKIVKDKSGNPDKSGVIATGAVSSGLISTDFGYIDVSFNSNPELSSDLTYWVVVESSDNNSNYYVWGYDNNSGYTNGVAKYSDDWTKSTPFLVGGDFNFKIWASRQEFLGSLDTITVKSAIGTVASVNAHNITNSTIYGNVFANSFSGGIVYGDIVADSLSHCTIRQDASYNFTNVCTFQGAETTPAVVPTDPPYLAMGVSESNITAWKNQATAGGIISSGDFTPISGSTIGPGVIGGNLDIPLNISVYIAGPVYVKGDITIGNSAAIKLSASNSTIIITDGWVETGTSVKINQPLSINGHIMLLSTAVCDEFFGFNHCNTEGSSVTIKNGSMTDIIVVPYGTLKMEENTRSVSLMADMLKLDNNLILNYDIGLTNIDFSSGPSGSWDFDSWREVE